MEYEELPSESTSRPIFRRNVNKTNNSKNSDIGDNSSLKAANKKVKSKITKRTASKAREKYALRRRKSQIQSTPKSNTSTIVFDNCSSTDEDMHNDNDSTATQKARWNDSSMCQISNHVEKNFMHLDDSLASDEAENNESFPQSNTGPKTTTKTKQDIWKYFTRQTRGELRCILCPKSSKVIYFSSDLPLNLPILRNYANAE